MPVALPKVERVPWKGEQYGFGDGGLRDLIKNGHPFVIIDARGDFGERKDVALLVQLCDQLGLPLENTAPFVMTFDETPSRTKLVESVREIAYADQPDVVGPVQIRRIPNRDQAKSPFMRICNLSDETAGGDIPF